MPATTQTYEPAMRRNYRTNYGKRAWDLMGKATKKGLDVAKLLELMRKKVSVGRGKPKTQVERKKMHGNLYGTEKLPKRGTSRAEYFQMLGKQKEKLL